MLDPLGIGTIREVFQLEGTKQVVIERLKSLVNTGVRLHATPFSIFADMPSGPFDLVVSSASKRSNTSSSEQRSSSGHPVGSRVTVSSVVSGGSAELKQRWKNEFRSSAFLLSSVMASLLHDNVGIRDELFPLIALIAAQNCLGFLALATLLT